jgi:quinoprotein glucose dehydrogenase
MSRWIRSLAVVALLGLVALAVPPEEEKKQKKKAENSPDASAARAQIEGGLKATVWAAEPQFQNPIAFSFDEAGRCYIVEANRYKDGVPDTRGHMYWLDEDIGAKSVADRVAMYKKHKYPQFEKFEDRVRVLWDSGNKGYADKEETFSAGYNRFEDGIAAGVLARKGSVYFTCIPDLYLLKDTNGDGKADEKKSLASGFGVRAQFQGHDLHGLRMGPDGKLYFSIGDRGMNVVNKEGKHLYYPDAGAVMRCDLDGANLEIVHTGLRNPQELAFDDFGNLFTYDNNCDSGDAARWVYIVEGGDSGWRCGYQYGTHMHTAAVPQGNRGPWNTEKLWHLQHEGQPAYIVPPLAHFGNGPSGLTHYPGVGLNDKYKDHFFACDFTASAANSKIWTLAVKPKGAAFEVTDLHAFAQQVVPTDCEFGPDGAFYWSDWLGGWDKPNKGRIFRATDPEAMKNPAIEEGRKLLLDGLEKLSVDELVKLLAHPHQNVRLESQLELANKAKADLKTVAFKLAALAQGKKANRLARLHAIWGLGIIEGGGKNSSLLLQSAKSLFKDEDVEVRAATAKTLGKYVAAWSSLATQLKVESDNRVKSHLLVSMGKLLPENSADQTRKNSSSWLPALEVLKANADKDVYLRQAAIEGLKYAFMAYDERYRQGPTRVYRLLWGEARALDSPSVELGLVVMLRKLKMSRISLESDDPKLLAEMARAIHDDMSIVTPNDHWSASGMESLAKILDKPGLPEAVAFRAISANLKLGTPEDAVRVANFAARSAEPDPLRISALKLLGEWAKPSKRDAVTGCRQELPDRDPAIAVNAVKPVVAKLFVGSDAVRKEAVQLVAKLGLTEVGALLAGIVNDAKQSGSTRAESLFALEALKAKELAETAKTALESSVPRLRAAARVVLAKANPTAAAKELPALLKDEQAATIEKQMAFGVLGTMKESQEVDAALAEWLDRLIADKVPEALKLDVLEAAEARTRTKGLNLHAPLKEKLADYDKQTRAKADGDMVKRNLEALSGGDAEKGREIVLNNAAVYCTRCHKLDGQGGDVGPALNGIAAMKDRLYLLESIVNPNAKIAMGFQSVIIDTLDGKQVSGIVKTQTAKEITLITAENKLITIPADDVDGKPKPDKSAMPDDLYKKISKRELRDVVEFLATLKEPRK